MQAALEATQRELDTLAEAITWAVDLRALERWMEIAQDIKKEFSYSKCESKWYWHDRGEEENLHGPHPTFFQCLHDAVEPYIEEDEENGS